MRILAVLLSPPVPATAGHRVRNRSLLHALALEGHEVTMLAYAGPNEIAAPSPENAKLCAAYRFVPDPESSMVSRLRAVFASSPYGALRLATPAMQRLVGEQLATKQFDAILCDDIYMAGNIPAGNKVPVILNKHDITSRIVRQFAKSDSNLLKKLYALLEARKIERLERGTCNSAHSVAVCSLRDQELLHELAPSARMCVVSNVIDVEKYSYRVSTERDTVLFVGAMDWLPNQDGAEFLVMNILPRLRQLVPSARVVIAGRNPTEEMVARFSEFPDVSFTGTVEDLRPVIAMAAVCVVPLRIGSGTRLKILEAGAMARPIVSTTLGAEGLELRDGVEIMHRDQARAFAEAVAAVLKDPGRAEQMGKAARTAVEQRYSIPALRAELRELLAPLRTGPVATPAGSVPR